MMRWRNWTKRACLQHVARDNNFRPVWYDSLALRSLKVFAAAGRLSGNR